MDKCFFCEIKDYILENDLALGKFDDFPVSKGHMIFVTKRHVPTFFETTKEERQAIFKLVDTAKKNVG